MPTWIIESDEAVEEMVERIAKAWFERPCERADTCNPKWHVWETAHDEDKAAAVNMATFVLEELGFDG